MTRILITGATGVLGQQVVKALADKPDIVVRLMSRRPIDPNSGIPRPLSRVSLRVLAGYGTSTSHARENTVSPFPATSWIQADLERGEHLSDALRDIDVIIHCAGDPRRLLEVARTTGLSHFVYISIVGCDRIPLFYYQQKVSEEASIKASGIPFSILRATQFHALIDLILRGGSRLPWLTLAATDFRFQSIAECEVGRRMAAIALEPPTGGIEELGGPQILSLGEMARKWITLRQMRRAVLSVRLPGKVAAGYRQGDNTCGTEFPHGEITWAQWVQTTYQGTPL